jgi:UDP-2,3-diacylglucosamine pyrophosphatase LpxH
MPKVRSVFLSDIHLGTRACQADRLLDFLREYQAEQTYLIGDIIDFWAMSRSIYWTPAQNTVVQKLLRRARHGERVVFIPGNHDEALRDYCGIIFGEIEVVDELIHETADGRRFLLIHGDVFDQVTRHHRWVAVLGDKAYDLLVRLNHWLSWGRRKLGISGYWSLAGYAKRKVKRRSISFSTLKIRPSITPASVGWMASSAAISTGRRSAKSTASLTSIAATGSTPVRPSSSTPTVASNWSSGVCAKRSSCSPRPLPNPNMRRLECAS